MPGLNRRTTRPQASENPTWKQSRFDGALNYDTPASKIGAYEFARAENVVCFGPWFEGHYGRKLLASQVVPGEGVKHFAWQHPKTGRVLFHRGDALWLSVDRSMDSWVEVTSLGPDGSLEATGTFTDGVATVTGDAAAYLSNMVITGATAGQEFGIVFIDGAGGDFTIELYANGDLVASADFNTADEPITAGVLAEVSGSGINAVVDIDAYSTAGPEPTGTATVTSYSVDFVLRGLQLSNTDGFDLYAVFTVFDAGNSSLSLYKDAAHTEEVATTGNFNNLVSDQITLESVNDTGISGYFDWVSLDIPVGVYNMSALDFDPEVIDLDADSEIAPFGETGFMVFLRGAAPQNIYVEQSLDQYWLLSTINGYGVSAPVGGDVGAYKYRYLTTYSRIVDPVTKAPAYGGNRISDLLQFEGPSNSGEEGQLDYNQLEWATPIEAGDPLPLEFAVSASRAASYITHFSIYRTLDVGIHGIGPDSAANNSEIYIWVADVPIYTTGYDDESSDELLRNRFAGGATQGENFALRSRFFREMSRGLGAIGPDFMATAVPESQTVTYCELYLVPRLVGFHYPGTQRFLLDDPISEIVRTKLLLVFLCPSSTYTSITQVKADTGVQGINAIPVIQNFEKASKTIGVKYGQGTFPIDESSFVSLISDGSIRVFSGSNWGEPLDGIKVHKIVERAQTGAVFTFQSGTILMWYSETPGYTNTDKCLRLGTEDQSGLGFTTIGRANWVYPPRRGGAFIVEDDDASLRTAVIDAADDVVFAVEDPPPLRQWKDDVVEATLPSLSGDATEFISNLVLNGLLPGIEYQLLISGVTPDEFAVYVYKDVDPLCEFHGLIADQPLIGAVLSESSGSGITGTFDIDGFVTGYVAGVIASGGAVKTGESEIVGTVRVRELTGSKESESAIHEESHAYFRFPDVSEEDFEITVKWYKNGVYVDEATGVPVGSDFSSYMNFFGNRIQIEYIIPKSGYQVVGLDTTYQTQDRRSILGTGHSNQSAYQSALGSSLSQRLSPNYPFLNMATALPYTVTGTAPTFVTGPSNLFRALRFAGGNYSSPQADIAGNFTVMAWIRLDDVEKTALNVCGLLIKSGVASAEDLEVSATDGTPVTFEGVLAPAADYHHVCVVREDFVTSVYVDAVMVGAIEAPSTLTGDFSTGDTGLDLYDVRVRPANALNAEAIAYYVNNVLNHNGNLVL